MANQRLTDKTELAEQAGSGDLLMVVDVSDQSSSAQGTSKKTDFKYVIQTDKISISNAEVLDLDANEKVLVGALSGYMITVFNVTVLCTHASPNESARKDLLFGFQDASDTVYWSKIDDMMDSVGADVSYVTQAQDSARTYTDIGSLINKPFVCWAQSTGFNGGWSADVYVTYAYTKVL
tara:strand:- start:4 stop:540 length:537 start_codon:yes stop_codon:yes gene_type:complete